MLKNQTLGLSFFSTVTSLTDVLDTLFNVCNVQDHYKVLTSILRFCLEKSLEQFRT